MRKAGDRPGGLLHHHACRAPASSAVDIDFDEGGDAVERASFAFTKIDVEYRVQGADGILGAASTFADELLSA